MRQTIRTVGQAGEIFRGRRKAQGLSQAVVARKLGISQGRYSTLEADPAAMSLERFLLLSKLLGLEVTLETVDREPRQGDW